MSLYSNLSVVLVALATLSPVGTPAQSPSGDASSLAEVRIFSQPDRAVPRGFMGLSHEWGNTMSMFGYSTTGANLVYRQLVTNLRAYGSDPIELRIGGNSTDTTGRPSGDRVKPYAELANALPRLHPGRESWRGRSCSHSESGGVLSEPNAEGGDRSDRNRQRARPLSQKKDASRAVWHERVSARFRYLETGHPPDASQRYASCRTVVVSARDDP